MSGSTEGFSSPTELVEEALSLAAGNAVVIVEEHYGANVRFANNTTTTNGRRRDRHVTVIAFDERADGIAASVVSGDGSTPIADLVRDAERSAKQLPVAEDASPLITGGVEDADYFDDVPTTDLSTLAAVLDALPDAFRRAETEATVLAGFAEHSVTTSFLGTSTGLRRRFVDPDGNLELVARAGDGTRSAWAGVGTADFSDVEIVILHERLRERLGWATRRFDLSPGRYDVVLPSDAVADLMIPLAEAAGGRDAEEGQSVFSRPGGGTRIGEELSRLPFVLESDPHRAGLQCSPFMLAGASGTDVSVFDNGCAIEPVRWIDEGHLRRLSYHRAGAARAQSTFTPPAENLILSAPGGAASVEELIRTIDHGLLLTCLWYIREVDRTTLLLTGLTRDGVYRIEDGEIIGAVNNFRFNESPLDVLARTKAVASTQRGLSREWHEWMSRTAMSPLVVEDFNMSSVSPAN